MDVDKIIRSDRKTISIEINSKGTVIVRAPRYSRDRDISAAITKNLEWIRKKKSDFLERTSKVKPKEYIDGENFYFLGKLYELSIEDNVNYNFRFDGAAFIINTEKLIFARQLFENFYKQSAKKIIPNRVLEFAKILDVDINRVRITSADKRWGSCSSKRNLNFSWRLIMAPTKVIDYVIVHEISHLFELNHSAKFWAIVEKLFPDYKAYRSWLRENSDLLIY